MRTPAAISRQTSSAPSIRRRVLLAHLISNGDCLYATTVARQIKHDDPGCHLTWAISERCQSILDGNPYVDARWVWPAFSNADLVHTWIEFTREARARLAAGEFDELYLTQADMGRWHGTLRQTILDGYPRPITVPLTPVMRLSAQEVATVRQFAARHGLERRSAGEAEPRMDAAPVILFECAPGSGQSFVTPDFAVQVARGLRTRFPSARVILSSHLAVADGGEGILDARGLTFRANAELSHYCALLVGCSSGLTWLCTSESAHLPPTVQLLSNHTLNSNSLAADFARQGLATDGIIELFDCSVEEAVACLVAVLDQGFPAARTRYHQQPAQLFHTYRQLWSGCLREHRYRAAAALLRRNRSVLLRPSMWFWHLRCLAGCLLRTRPGATTAALAGDA